jgi:hypothetical protein
VYATAKIEVFDPETQLFTLIDPGLDSTLATAQVRAFHSAYLLTSDPGKAKILLVGGVTSADGTDFTPVVEIDGTVLLDVAPYSDAKAAGPEIVEIDLTTLQVTRTAIKTGGPAARFMHGSTEFPPAPLASGYPLLAGGAAGGKGKSELPTPVVTMEFEDATGAKPGTPRLADTPIAVGRLGATVTDVGPVDTGGGAKPTWLILGGNLWSADATALGAEMAEYAQVTLTGDVPQSATSALTTVPLIPATAFHTTTPVRDQDGKLALLVAGGFIIEPSVLAPSKMAAFDPAPPGSGKPIMSLITAPGQVSTIDTPAGFKAVGFHDAVRLADNSVLVTGGNAYDPMSTSLPNECPWNDECRPVPEPCTGARAQQNSRQCAVCQAARYFHDRSTAARHVEAQGSLKIARFGHRSTLLWDGRVLVTGGITSRLGSQACSGTDILMMLTSAELYNPQGQSDDPITEAADPNSTADPPAKLAARNPGEVIADDCCQCPSSIDEAKKLAKRCAGKPKSCVWRLE